MKTQCAYCSQEIGRDGMNYEYFLERSQLRFCSEDCLTRWLTEHPKAVIKAFRIEKAAGFT